jgi:hypothetical protein
MTNAPPERIYLSPLWLDKGTSLVIETPGDIEYLSPSAVQTMIAAEREKALEEAAKVCDEKAMFELPPGCRASCHLSDALEIRCFKTDTQNGGGV